MHAVQHMDLYPLEGHSQEEIQNPNFNFFYFFFGVGFESALDPERPFSVLSIPDEVTRHSLLQKWKSVAIKRMFS